jgi:hypothetical protein
LFIGLVPGFYSNGWSQLSPEKADSVTGKLATLISRTLVCAGIVAWLVKRKGYRLLAFSVVCAIMTAINMYYFHAGKQSAEQKQESTVKISQ